MTQVDNEAGNRLCLTTLRTGDTMNRFTIVISIIVAYWIIIALLFTYAASAEQIRPKRWSPPRPPMGCHIIDIYEDHAAVAKCRNGYTIAYDPDPEKGKPGYYRKCPVRNKLANPSYYTCSGNLRGYNLT